MLKDLRYFIGLLASLYNYAFGISNELLLSICSQLNSN